ACELSGNAVLHELRADRRLYFLEKLLVNRRFLRDFPLQREKRLRLKVAEGKILEFAPDEAHAEAMRYRRVNVERFAGDALLTRRLKEFERPHIVKAVGEFDHDDADIVDHRQEHLADVFSLAGLG